MTLYNATAPIEKSGSSGYFASGWEAFKTGGGYLHPVGPRRSAAARTSPMSLGLAPDSR
jgi:hypothetical protein